MHYIIRNAIIYTVTLSIAIFYLFQPNEKRKEFGKMKKLMLIAIGCAALISSAAEVVFDGNKAAAWNSNRFADGNDVVTGTLGYLAVKSKKMIPIEAGKKYVFSGEFRMINTPAKAPILYFGFFPMTADGKEISYLSVTSAAKNLAEVAKDVKVGDTSITLKGAESWKPSVYHRIVFNAREDKSDLPNFDIAPIPDWTKLKKNADGTIEVFFKKPLTKACAAGTKVRLHSAGASYVYAGSRKMNNEWVTFKKEFKVFYPGTAKIRPAMNLNAASCQFELRNIKVTVE